MTAKYSGLNKRRIQRRQKSDRRADIRWEPTKQERRKGQGQRKEDGWQAPKKD
jgi:hypothetical protein